MPQEPAVKQPLQMEIYRYSIAVNDPTLDEIGWYRGNSDRFPHNPVA